jgi:2-oxoglutarate dehydrogenase E1 component
LEKSSLPKTTKTKTAFFSTASVPQKLHHEGETFLTGSTAIYAEQQYELYKLDRDSVHESWRRYFDNLENGIRFNEAAQFNQPSSLFYSNSVPSQPVEGSSSLSTKPATVSDSLGVAHLIRAYQVNGHTAAHLDPLQVHSKETFPYRPFPTESGYPPELTIEYHGFTEADLDRKLNLLGTSSGGNKGYLEEIANSPERITLRQILATLRKTYTGTLGVEYMHIGDNDKMNWIRERVEQPRWLKYDKEKKQHIFERLCFADTFENFLDFKFNTTKRFGLDGGEAIVPGLKDAIDLASELGAHSFVLGMPHRGRLNILANVMRKPMPLIFAEFQGIHYKIEDHLDSDDHWGMSGDVKCTYQFIVCLERICTNFFFNILTHPCVYSFFFHLSLGIHRSLGFIHGSYLSGWSTYPFESRGESIASRMRQPRRRRKNSCQTILLWQPS